MTPRELFLSHATGDSSFADALAEVLRRHGIPVWLGRTNITGSQQWHDEIGAALRRCDWFLVVLSPASVESMWVKRELAYALQQRQYESHIVPVLLTPCDYERLSWTLSLYQIVDFTGGLEAGCRELLRIWGLGHHL